VKLLTWFTLCYVNGPWAIGNLDLLEYLRDGYEKKVVEKVGWDGMNLITRELNSRLLLTTKELYWSTLGRLYTFFFNVIIKNYFIHSNIYILGVLI
jgi:hypothetical protein